MLPIPRIFKRRARFVGQGFRTGNYAKPAPRALRCERMTSSVDLPFMEPESIFDASTMGTARQHARRSDRYRPAVSTHDTGRVPAVGHEGMSGPAACAALMCLIAVLGIACLVGRSGVIEAGKKANDLQKRIEDVTLSNESLETQLAISASEVNVGYEAVQLGMISAKGVDVIYLSGPDDAVLKLAGSTTSITSEYLATILGD